MIKTFKLAAYSVRIYAYQGKIVLNIVLTQPSSVFLFVIAIYAPLFRDICHIACTKKGKLLLYANWLTNAGCIQGLLLF